MRKKIFKWFLILFVIVFLFSSFTSRAEDLGGYTGYTEYWEFDGQYYPYCLIEKFTAHDMSGVPIIYTFDKPVYAFAYRNSNGNTRMLFSCKETFSLNRLHGNGNLNISANYDNTYGYYWTSDNMAVSSIDIPYFSYTGKASTFEKAWGAFFDSDIFIPINPMIPINPVGVIPNSNFALFNPRASVVDGILSATWQNGLLNYWPASFVDMPLLVDLCITDRDTGQKLYTSYPARSALPDAERLTMFDVQDYSLAFSLAKIENLPTNFTLDYIILTPYYRQKIPEKSDLVVYKGQSSMLLIGYDGVMDGVIQVLPDTPVPEPEPDDPSWGIFGLLSNFFGGFFNNLGGMLKDLFIPTKDQLLSLFGELEEFFTEKLGFLWYPFDFAIEIAQAFGEGYADSSFTVPPIDIDILGGIHLYDGGTFDMDATGIFSYVRIFTSIVLSCATLGLAMNKWDEFIKGEFGE